MTLGNRTHREPLIKKIVEIASLWLVANLGYYMLFPALGYELDYNAEPFYIALYFLGWSAFAVYYFWPLFKYSLALDGRIRTEAIISLGFATVISAVLYGFSHLPSLKGPSFAPYTDILLATPWYFLPKMAEILMQQLLITVFVLEVWERMRSLASVITWYVLAFGGAHVVLCALSSAPTQHATFMTTAAVLSSALFPYLLLRVRGGFIYSYAIHVLFYLGLALVLHSWPPPGYGA